MKKLIGIDSHVFVWGIRGVSSAGQELKIPQAKSLLSLIDPKEKAIVLAAPMLAEILSVVPPSEHHTILSLIDSRFHVYPFDAPAAYKCAELLHKSYTDAQLIEYRQTHNVPKQKLKYDCMIAAICITRKAECIYSEDPDLIKFSDGQITIKKLPAIQPIVNQPTLFGNQG